MFIFGLGTGRCGTVSLSDLLNGQDNIVSDHETDVCAWEYNEEDYARLLGVVLKRAQNGNIGSECAFYILPYVERILQDHPDSKFICLKRERDEVIASYLRKTTGRNHWTFSNSEFWLSTDRLDEKWDKCYPSYNLSKFYALQAYWNDYYSLASILEKKFPDNFKVFDMYEVLNEQSHQTMLFEFLGMPIEDVNFNIGVKRNS